MFATNALRIVTRRLLFTSSMKWKPVSTASESSMQINAEMKKLIDARRYQDVLALFTRQSRVSSDVTFNLALKACSNLGDRKRGIDIHRQLSPQALRNPFIQTSLIHFYSEVNVIHSKQSARPVRFFLFLVQCRDTDRAHQIFATAQRKTVFMYGALFKGTLAVVKESFRVDF